jgi:PHD/YefM family antitoxin component YafN of YafNO toxin-antitoxin module
LDIITNMDQSGKPADDAIAVLTRIPASDVKRRGWRGVIETLGSERALLVTNHERPEAVIVSTEEYARLTAHAADAKARTEGELERLRRRFDERLAVLRAPQARERLRGAMKGPTRLRGKVKAGTSY